MGMLPELLLMLRMFNCYYALMLSKNEIPVPVLKNMSLILSIISLNVNVRYILAREERKNY